jgi:hypothetical protein
MHEAQSAIALEDIESPPGNQDQLPGSTAGLHTQGADGVVHRLSLFRHSAGVRRMAYTTTGHTDPLSFSGQKISGCDPHLATAPAAYPGPPLPAFH